MDPTASKIIATLVGGLIVWLVTKFYNRSRLYCAPNMLHEYSDLSEGCTVQLSISNKGRKNEEQVTIQLSNEYSYSMIAATQSGLQIDKNKCLNIPVLLSNSDISIIFLAEGKPAFSKSGVKSIKSKSSLGKVTSSVSDTKINNIDLLIVTSAILILPIFGYFFGKTIGELAWEKLKTKIYPINPVSFTENCPTYYSNAPEKPKKNELSEESLAALAKKSVIVEGVGIQGSKIVADLRVVNLVDTKIKYSVKLYSHAMDSYNRSITLDNNNYVYNIVLMNEDESRSYKLSESFPEDMPPKFFWIETRVEMLGYWVTVDRSFAIGKNEKEICQPNSQN